MFRARLTRPTYASQTEDLLAERAAKADLTQYWVILKKVPDAPPLPGDELPPESSTKANGRRMRQLLIFERVGTLFVPTE